MDTRGEKTPGTEAQGGEPDGKRHKKKRGGRDEEEEGDMKRVVICLTKVESDR